MVFVFAPLSISGMYQTHRLNPWAPAAPLFRDREQAGPNSPLPRCNGRERRRPSVKLFGEAGDSRRTQRSPKRPYDMKSRFTDSNPPVNAHLCRGKLSSTCKQQKQCRAVLRDERVDPWTQDALCHTAVLTSLDFTAVQICTGVRFRSKSKRKRPESTSTRLDVIQREAYPRTRSWIGE
jgi:hypothetical protein